MKLLPATLPLEYVSIDPLGELTTSKRGARHLLVITDRFTKLVREVSLKTITGVPVAEAFIYHWVYYYGPPKTLLSDNGKQFIGRFFMDIRRLLVIRNFLTTTYHPQCNGEVERFNRTIEAALRHYIAEHAGDRDLYTDTLCYAYKTKVHTATKITPFELLLSRSSPSLPILVEDERNPSKSTPMQKHLKLREELW